MAVHEREKREIQIFIRGAWKITKAIVTDKELCKYPPCNKKIPSRRSNYQKERHIPKGYCSEDCWKDHKNNKQLKTKLNDFLKEKNVQ